MARRLKVDFAVRHKEVKAMRNRLKAARKARITPTDIAIEILAKEGITFKKFPDDFLGQDVSADFKTIEVPAGEARMGTDLFDYSAQDTGAKHRLTVGKVQIGETILDMGSPERAAYVKALSDSGVHGQCKIPLEPRVCSAILARFEEYHAQTLSHFSSAASSYTNDQKKQKAILRELDRLAFKTR